MPLYNVEPRIFKQTIDSISSQWYSNWELCIYDDASEQPDTVKFLDRDFQKTLKKDSRIRFKRGEKNVNISEATNKAVDLSTGEYLFFMDNDDLIPENALYEFVKSINLIDFVDIIYFDEDKIDKYGSRIDPYFKPDYSKELLLSQMYLTHPVVSRKVFEKVGRMRKGFEGSQDYDLAFRITEITEKIIHIPKVLYHWRKSPSSTADSIDAKSYAITAAKKALREAMERQELKGRIMNEIYPFHVILNSKKKHSVEIIILSKDKGEVLSKLIDSIESKTKLHKSRVRITIVDHDSKEPYARNLLGNLSKRSNYKIMNYSGEFNFSKMNNFASKESDSEFFLFLNNDMEVLTDDWIDKFLGYAEIDGIGAISGKLIYPGNKIQHAGVVLGVGGVANHAYYKAPKDSEFYFNHLNSIRNYSALTGACLFVSTRVFEEVNGFDEKLPGAYNDVDLCLKIHKKGYRNLYIPFIEITHFESMSRNPKVSEYEDNFMYNKWEPLIQADPFYNPNLNKNLEKGKIFEIITT
jgi:GT2 family glycosyltransferase